MFNMLTLGATSMVYQDGMIRDRFLDVFMPILINIIEIAGAVGLVWGVLYLFRKQVNEFWDRLKWISIGLVLVKCVRGYVDLCGVVGEQLDASIMKNSFLFHHPVTTEIINKIMGG